MTEEIIYCEKCELFKNQEPILDMAKKCQVFWVGLSAKKGETPLSENTNTGRIICEINERMPDVLSYKTNLVKCVPLDGEDKLRYPSESEIAMCIPHLDEEIRLLSPKIVVLLGQKVADAVKLHHKIEFEKTFNFDYCATLYRRVFYMPVQHPSYICVYRRKQKDEYISSIERFVRQYISEYEERCV